MIYLTTQQVNSLANKTGEHYTRTGKQS